jgi:hypothetical protein
MSGLMGSLLGKRDPKQQATQAIVGLREQLAMIDKKEEHLDRRIEEETNTAKALLADNKRRKLCPLCLEAGALIRVRAFLYSRGNGSAKEKEGIRSVKRSNEWDASHIRNATGCIGELFVQCSYDVRLVQLSEGIEADPKGSRYR